MVSRWRMLDVRGISFPLYHAQLAEAYRDAPEDESQKWPLGFKVERMSKHQEVGISIPRTIKSFHRHNLI